MIFIIKRLLQLLGYALLVFTFLISLGYMNRIGERDIYIGLTLYIFVLSLFSMIVWKKRKKLRDVKIGNIFKLDDNLNGDEKPNSIGNKVFLSLAFLVVGSLVLFCLFWVAFGVISAISARDHIKGFEGTSLFSIAFPIVFIFLPIVGLIKIKLKKKHPYEDFKELYIFLVRSASRRFGFAPYVIISFLLICSIGAFNLNHAERFALLPFLGVTLLISFIFSLTSFIFAIGHAVNKNLKPLSEYIESNLLKSNKDAWSGMSVFLGYYGFMIFKIFAIANFLLNLMFNHEFRLASLLVCLPFLFPEIYKFVTSSNK